MAIIKRVCNKCNIEKPLTKKYFRTTFNYYKGVKKEYFRRGCIDCEKVYWKENNKKNWQRGKIRLQKLREEMVEYLGGKCSICKMSFHTCVYDFHHKDPKTKKYNVSSMVGNYSSNRELIFKELDKCLLLCSNCHRNFHWGDSNSHN